jgi:hypothetical protein
MQGHDYNLKRIEYRNRDETKKRKSSLFAPVRPYKMRDGYEAKSKQIAANDVIQFTPVCAEQ